MRTWSSLLRVGMLPEDYEPPDYPSDVLPLADEMDYQDLQGIQGPLVSERGDERFGWPKQHPHSRSRPSKGPLCSQCYDLVGAQIAQGDHSPSLLTHLGIPGHRFNWSWGYESMVRTAELFNVSEWEDGRVEEKFRNSFSTQKFDEDGDYEYHLTERDKGGENPRTGEPFKAYTSWAVHKPTDSVVGALSWGDNRNGVVSGVSTHPVYRRRGIATELFRRSVAHAFEHGYTAPRHAPSLERTTDGDLWVSGLGAEDWDQGERSRP